MGAAHWDARVLNEDGEEVVNNDFRAMTTDQRKSWYGVFMGSVRRTLRGGKPSTSRRSKAGARRRRRARH
jgi:hypothetical protein